jgi:hypothetical protein
MAIIMGTGSQTLEENFHTRNAVFLVTESIGCMVLEINVFYIHHVTGEPDCLKSIFDMTQLQETMKSKGMQVDLNVSEDAGRYT